ncbi:hypothetical protein C8J57DRAFT_1511063 [Mycena rebaudengoi]|nr:hypothetical protein C8J57DRAFT_1511063 [Mycena rebaudengoi]
MVHTEASVATPQQCGVVQAPNAFRWLSAPYRNALRFLQTVILVQDPVARICLNRSARRKQRTIKPHLLSGPHPPAFEMNLDLRSILEYSQLLIREVWHNCTKTSNTSIRLSLVRPVFNRTAQRHRMLQNWREARRKESTISWSLWKQVAAVFRSLEMSGLPPEHGQRYTGYVPLPSSPSTPRSIRQARPFSLHRLLLVLFLLGSCVIHCASAPSTSSVLGKRAYDTCMARNYPETPTASSSAPFHFVLGPVPGLRQCEWQEYGVRCTQHTLDINVPFCAVHGICVDYELAVGGTPAAHDLHEIETPPDFDAAPRKRSRKGKEKETQQPSNVIQDARDLDLIQQPASTSEFRIIYAAIDNAQKKRTLQHLISTTLEHKTKATANAVFAVAAEHQMTRCKRDVLIPLMRAHTCQWDCLVRAADAATAGEIMYSQQQPEEFGRAPVSRPPRPPRASRCFTDEQRLAQASNRARQRAENANRAVHKDNADIEWWRENWPQEESSEALKQASPHPWLHLTSSLLIIVPRLFANIGSRPLRKSLAEGLAPFATAMSSV